MTVSSNPSKYLGTHVAGKRMVTDRPVKGVKAERHFTPHKQPLAVLVVVLPGEMGPMATCDMHPPATIRIRAWNRQ
jgi:hypothetical protein